MTDIMKLATDYAQACYNLANPDSYDAERAEEARAALQSAIEALQGENERLAHANNALKLEVSGLQSQLDALEKQEPIYQYQMGDGSWIDQTKHSYDYNRNHAPNAVVRIVYAAPKALAPLTRKQISDLDEEGVFLGNIYEITKEIEAAHGIGGTP